LKLFVIQLAIFSAVCNLGLSVRDALPAPSQESPGAYFFFRMSRNLAGGLVVTWLVVDGF